MNRVVTAALAPTSLSSLTKPVDSLCDPRLRLLAELLLDVLEDVLEDALEELLEDLLEELILDEDSELGVVDSGFCWHARLAEVSASESLGTLTDVPDESDREKSASPLSSTAT